MTSTFPVLIDGVTTAMVTLACVAAEHGSFNRVRQMASIRIPIYRAQASLRIVIGLAVFADTGPTNRHTDRHEPRYSFARYYTVSQKKRQ